MLIKSQPAWQLPAAQATPAHFFNPLPPLAHASAARPCLARARRPWRPSLTPPAIAAPCRPGLCRSRLAAAGVSASSALGADTYAAEDLCSYRRTCHRGEPDYGRNLSVIALAERS